MDFQSAFVSLENGQFITTPSLKKEGVYLCLMPAMPFIWQVKTKPAGQAQAGAWPISVDALKASDYEIFTSLEQFEEVEDAA